MIAVWASLAVSAFAQKRDTVIIESDNRFISKFSKRLNIDRKNLKYKMEERGSIRDLRVFLSTLEDLETNEKMYAVRIDSRGNLGLFSDNPLNAAEYIDMDELDKVIGYLSTIYNQIKTSDFSGSVYEEYRFYTRGGIMFECYTGINRWRFCIHYKSGIFGINNLLAIDKADDYTYINRREGIKELMEVMIGIKNELKL
ncbi:MAG: hypothetical protein ACOVNR_07360 [Chitinophagaceae bacterium]